MQEHYLRTELTEWIRTDPGVLEFLESAALAGLWFRDLENPEEEWMSPAFWQTLGIDPDTMPHKSSGSQSLIFPEDLETATDNLARHCADPSSSYDQVVRYRHADGSTVWIRCRGLAMRDVNGRPIRLLGAHNDITAMRRAASRAVAGAKSSAVARLAAGVAHELNNVLFAVLGNAELLEEDLAADRNSGDLAEYARDITEAAERGARIVSGLLQYSRQQTLAPGLVSVADVLRQIVNLLSHSLGSRIKMTLRMPDDLGLAILDGDRLQTAIVHLAINAQRALDGGGEIVIEGRIVEPAQAGPASVEIVVLDRGVGMSDAVLARCREPFFTTHADEQADGMGLSFVADLAKQSGGELDVHSGPGEGTRVVLRLPTVERDPATADT